MKKVSDLWPRGVGANGLLRCCKHNEPAIMLLAYAVTFRRESLIRPQKTLVCVSSYQQALSMNMSMGICKEGALDILASFGNNKMSEFYFLAQVTKQLSLKSPVLGCASVRFINRTQPVFDLLRLNGWPSIFRTEVNFELLITSYQVKHLLST
jgi:hypothetical protein